VTPPDSNQWSLAAELQRVAGVEGVATALHALGLISRSESSYRLVGADGQWVRGGAESYIFRFQVDEDIAVKDVMIKACVAFGPGGRLSEILERWVQRRNLLRANGIATPQLYGYGHGVLIEEYVPHSLGEALCSASSNRKELLSGLAIYAAALSKLGFAPIGPFEDLRSRGRDVVVVDFGEDLGPPGVSNTARPEMFQMLATYMRKLGTSLSDDEADELQGIFAAHEGRLLQ
jgi:hypothetical protein